MIVSRPVVVVVAEVVAVVVVVVVVVVVARAGVDRVAEAMARAVASCRHQQSQNSRVQDST